MLEKNRSRTHEIPEGQSWVLSETMGMVKDKTNAVRLAAATRRYPKLTAILARWLRERLPEEVRGFTFSSMSVNLDYAARPHRDSSDFGPQVIRALGAFTGGKLNY